MRPSKKSTLRDFRAQIEANLFGVVNVTRAALPVLRAQRSGVFVQFSSIGGRVGGTPGLGAYQAAKFAVEGFSEVLANEVAGFGVKVIIVEPGAFRTDWTGSSMTMQDPGPDYRDALDFMHEFRRSSNGTQPGDPARAARVIIDVVDHPNRRGGCCWEATPSTWHWPVAPNAMRRRSVGRQSAEVRTSLSKG